jgi:hypothetical protein
MTLGEVKPTSEMTNSEWQETNVEGLSDLLNVPFCGAFGSSSILEKIHYLPQVTIAGNGRRQPAYSY